MAVTVLQVLMVAILIAAMLLIRFYVAPIVTSYGIAGVLIWIVGCLAVGKRLED